MLKLFFNKDDSLNFEKKKQCHLGEYLKKMTPNSGDGLHGIMKCTCTLINGKP